MEFGNNITITANKEKKILTIKIDYSKVIDYTAKANKEVFANLYYRKISNDYVLNLQLLGKKVAIVDDVVVIKEVKEEKFTM